MILMKAPLYTGKSWIGAAAEIQKNPLELYVRIHREYGPLVRIRILPGMEMYSMASPECMEHVLRKNQKNYPKPALFARALGPLTGLGLITNESATWHSQRKLIAPGFHFRQIGKMVSLMVEETEKLADQWQNKQGEVVDVLEDMMFLTLNIVSRSLFSTDVMSAAGQISEAVREAFEYAGYRLNTPFSLHEMLTGQRKRRFRKAKIILDDCLDSIIRQRLESGDLGEDLLGVLLAARDEESGEGMDEIQLRDELLTLMIAGHETTAAALSWAWYLLAQNPEKAQNLASSSKGFEANSEDPNILKSLPDYAKWVFEESMRLYPPAWGVPRESMETDQLLGYEIQKKKVVNCAFHAMFRDPNIWENPEAFVPERFGVAQSEDRPRYAIIPFGLGKRQCVGMNMALVEGPLILAILAQKFRFELAEPEQKVEIDATFALRPKGGLPMRIISNS